MNLLFLSYVIIFGASAVAVFASIPKARTIQHQGTREGFVVFLFSVGLWSLGYVGYLVLPTRTLKIASYTIGFIFAFVAVGAWLYFSAAYTGRPPRLAPFRKTILSVFIAFILLKLLNPFHHLFFTTSWATEPFPHLAVEHGVLYWVTLGLSYIIVGIGFWMLVERFYYAGSDTRPFLVLISFTAIPAIATVSNEFVSGLLPLMYEPPGVALFAVGTLFVYFRQFETIRFAAERGEPTIFLDPDNRIRDYNQSATEVFPSLKGSAGRAIGELDDNLSERLNESGVIQLQQDDDTRYFQVSKNPFSTSGTPTGKLVTLSEVTERETYRRELEETTHQLELLNRIVRHDIRNDMNVIYGWANTLDGHVDETGQDALARVQKTSKQVIDLTEIAREFIEVIKGEDEPDLHPIDISSTVQTEVSKAKDVHPNADIHIEGEIPSVKVEANEMVGSIFRNLLNNAVQHTDEQTPLIHVTGKRSEANVQIRIADNGPGIPDDQKETIFGKGEQGLESEGSGIGLHLVYTLTRQFGGNVWIEDNESKGSIFVVELPVAD